MYDFKRTKRVKITVDILQNERTAKNYGCNIEKGQEMWIMVLGNVVNVKDPEKPEEAYYLEDVEGKKNNRRISCRICTHRKPKIYAVPFSTRILWSF